MILQFNPEHNECEVFASSERSMILSLHRCIFVNLLLIDSEKLENGGE